MVTGNEFASNPQRPVAEALQTITSSDVEDFARLLSQLTDRPLTEEEIAHNLLNTVASPTSRIVVIRDGADRVQASATGTICLIPTGKKGWVDDVVTDRAHRRRGYSRILMHSLHDWFAQNGVVSVNLTSAPEREEAWRHYEGLGYRRRDTAVFRTRLGSAALEE